MFIRARVMSIYIANFFFSLHYALLVYINSSFLGKFFTPGAVSALFALGAVGSILAFLLAPSLLLRSGVKRSLIYILAIDYAALTGLTLAHSPALVAFSFVLFSTTVLLIPLCLDIFLEARTRESLTGEIRGTNLTIGSLGILLAPLIISVIAFDSQFRLVYILSALALLPLILVSVFFKKIPSNFHTKVSILAINLRAYSKDLRRVALVRLILEFFYAIMTIYVPVYLYEVIGFSWHAIGIIFTIMLLPFVLIERPLGKLADHKWGEKEIMTTGLVLASVAVFILPFLEASLVAWALVLFLSRIGASSIEVSSESYFFKHVNKDDTALISIFRMMRPAGVILGSAAGIALINMCSYTTMFFLLSAVVFLGTLLSARIADTL
ncbi:MFS transporter [Candidatus Parcubacteria bacterium]|nr:MFS transporter [Candidatus Parcubacteria bacterium]